MTQDNFKGAENREKENRNQNPDLDSVDSPEQFENEIELASDRAEHFPPSNGFNEDLSQDRRTFLIEPGNSSFTNPAEELHNMAAMGGAVGGLVLGIWAVVSSLITYFAAIIAVIAVLLGIYGLKSRQVTMAGIGIALGIIAMLFCLMEVNEMVGNLFATE